LQVIHKETHILVYNSYSAKTQMKQVQKSIGIQKQTKTEEKQLK